jgi:hypothetical protein
MHAALSVGVLSWEAICMNLCAILLRVLRQRCLREVTPLESALSGSSRRTLAGKHPLISEHEKKTTGELRLVLVQCLLRHIWTRIVHETFRPLGSVMGLVHCVSLAPKAGRQLRWWLRGSVTVVDRPRGYSAHLLYLQCARCTLIIMSRL